jgi:hypothetical protein
MDATNATNELRHHDPSPWMPLMPIQIKRQNPRGGAGGVAVKMTSPIRVLAQHACAHHGALSPQVLHIGNLTFEAMKLAQQDDGSAVAALHADCMRIAKPDAAELLDDCMLIASLIR